MPILSVVYDLTDYTAVMAVCIVLTVVLAGIIVAMAVLNYVRSGARQSETPAGGDEADEEDEGETAASMTPAVDRSLLPAFFDTLCEGMSAESREKFATLITSGETQKLRYRTPLTSYETEKDFLKDTFLSFSALGGELPTDAAETLFTKYVGMLTSAAAITRINNKMVRFYFARRTKEADALDKCVKLCKKDIAFNFNKFDAPGRKIPSLKRLILIYTAQKKYAEALNLCDEAISREVLERKDEGYEDRKARLLGKKRREDEKAAEKAAREAARAEAREEAKRRRAAARAAAREEEKKRRAQEREAQKVNGGESDNGGAV